MSGRLATIPGIGEHVYLQSAGRWGQVVAWPSDAVKSVSDLKQTHLRVQPVTSGGKPMGEPQFWPLTQTAITNESAAETIRPFVSRVEQRAKDKAKRVKKPPPDDDADIPPDKPLEVEPLERED